MSPRLPVAALLALALLACRGEPAAPADASLPELVRVTAGRTDLLFRYAKGDTVETATKLDEVPVEAREAVQVVDLSRSPDERGAQGYVQVFDLRTPSADGTFPGKVVPRQDLEAALRKSAAPAPQAPVTIYTAAWCGVCKKAKQFMQSQGIAFVDKDIEKDPAAAAEIGRKAQAAGVPASGVPIFDVGGRILGGFDEKTLLAAVRESTVAR